MLLSASVTASLLTLCSVSGDSVAFVARGVNEAHRSGARASQRWRA
jgi:hypothetical protein